MENWKDVVGFEDYFQVSDKGNVWSKRSNRILKPGKSKAGYPVITTRIGGRKGKCFCKKVHRWVAEAFIDNPDDLPFVNHKDGIKTNNDVENLEWCTNRYNLKHAKDNGLLRGLKGFDNTQSKLKDEDVLYIRSVYIPRDKTYGARRLAEKFDIDHSTISDICNRKIWKHI